MPPPVRAKAGREAIFPDRGAQHRDPVCCRPRVTSGCPTRAPAAVRRSLARRVREPDGNAPGDYACRSGKPCQSGESWVALHAHRRGPLVVRGRARGSSFCRRVARAYECRTRHGASPPTVPRAGNELSLLSSRDGRRPNTSRRSQRRRPCKRPTSSRGASQARSLRPHRLGPGSASLEEVQARSESDEA
jgi:hypothetical protein